MTGEEATDWTALGEEWGVEVTPTTAERLQELSVWLAERGLPLGLTNYPSPQRIAEHHMTPALAAFRLPDFPQRGFLLDLGAGSGALGLTLAVLCPRLRVTLADRRRRSQAFIVLTTTRLGIKNAQAVQVEGEVLGKEHPGEFKVVGFRALAHAEEALRLCAPLVSPSGFVAAWHQAAAPEYLNPPAGWERLATIPTSLAGLSVSQFRRTAVS